MGFCNFSKFNLLFFILSFIIVSAQENGQIVNQKSSLISFMSNIISDPKQSLKTWNSSTIHECYWSGIKCNINKTRVLELDLSGNSLSGTISPAISNLSHLTILDLSGNFFVGHIPAQLGSLLSLKQLSLSSNLLKGNIPTQLGHLQNLVYLNLANNHLTGEIPFSLFCNGPSSLQYIDLSNNSISGKIPFENQCELRNLRFLLLWSNQLAGEIPKALSNSSKLEWLDLESNSLTGELPYEVMHKLPKLQFLYLSYNHFSSHNGNTDLKPFFSSLANSSNLQELELAGNGIGGEIPSFIGDLSTNLVEVHLDENLLIGSIPPQISNLVNLTLLNLSSNFLNGSIPNGLYRMEKLERLYLSNNSLSGEIPSDFGDFPHLGLLDLSKNKLSGPIPDSFDDLSQLRKLLLYENRLSGAIPQSLGKCENLEILDLSRNRISGVIPSEVARLSSLKLYLNLSNNHLSGPIPLELSKMDMVIEIDLSSNNLSGHIPSQLGSCIALEYLNLSNNFLEGPLPLSIGQLPYLKGIDVSFNGLTGEIPESLHASSSLRQLNLSFNDFSGNVSSEGAFTSLTIDSFLGNRGLCGLIKGMSRCHKKRSYRVIILPVVVSVFVALIFCFVGCPLMLKLKFRRELAVFSASDMVEEKGEETKEVKFPKISYQQLVTATGEFSSSNLIGSGRFGHVYKGVLQDNTNIAVKVIDPKTSAEKLTGSFKKECQILKRTRHRNLIKIITICSRTDFKALVLPLMPKGSLESHLYPKHGPGCVLDLAQIVSICGDVAQGLAYLHHHSPVRVVHCDLKPSNILLDDDLTALVTDFGIAKVVRGGDENIFVSDSVSFSSGDGLLCGSVGYIAPEYGMGRQASIQGDVYSFGIILLEIITTKRPTDILPHQASGLHDWVKSHYPYNLEPIIEATMARYTLGATPGHHIKMWREVVLEMIELGLMCTQYSPSTRPTMEDVAHEMGRLKEYLHNPHLTMSIDDVTTKVDAFSL